LPIVPLPPALAVAGCSCFYILFCCCHHRCCFCHCRLIVASKMFIDFVVALLLLLALLLMLGECCIFSNFFSLFSTSSLYCIALCRVALHPTALHCAPLHCIAPHCIASCPTLLCRAPLHCVASQSTALFCVGLHCIPSHCTPLWFVVLHRVLRWSPLHHVVLSHAPVVSRRVALHQDEFCCIVVAALIARCWLIAVFWIFFNFCSSFANFLAGLPAMQLPSTPALLDCSPFKHPLPVPPFDCYFCCCSHRSLHCSCVTLP